MTRNPRVLAAVTRVLAVGLLPVAFLRSPGRARYFACQWAIGLRYPAEDLAGLTPAAAKAFTEARTLAFWRDHQLIGLTDGHRDAAVQHRMFLAEIQRTGSVAAARARVLPPEESAHVSGYAMDVRPTEGAAWLERHGPAFGLYRRYDNEWWHFEHHWHAPPRLPSPAVAAEAATVIFPGQGHLSRGAVVAHSSGDRVGAEPTWSSRQRPAPSQYPHTRVQPYRNRQPW